VGHAVGVGDCVRAGAGPFLGRRGVGVGDCVGAGTGRFLAVRRGAGVGDCVGAGAGRFFGVRCGAGVADCVGAGAGRFLGVGDCVGARAGRFLGLRCSVGVADCVGAGGGCFLGPRRGAGVGDCVGAGGQAGGSLGVSGCLRPRLPGTGGGIITGTAKGLAGARSRTGVTSGLAALAAALCLSAADSVLVLVDPWLAGMDAGSAVGAPISGSRSTGSIAIFRFSVANAARASAMASHIACLDFRTFFATSCIS
jgi:hypothetical protein